MRILRIILLFTIVFVATFFIGKGILAGSSLTSSVVDPSVLMSTNLPDNSSSFNIKSPARLLVPALGINAESESVGMDDQGRMDVPKNVVNVAWYNQGVKPGETGNAVFAGHFDKPDGNPAVFYDLNQLKAGDQLVVEDVDGNRLTFEVTEKKVVPLKEFPLEEVFGPIDKARVNLITCGGIWDKSEKEYSERTIIFSELKQR